MTVRKMMKNKYLGLLLRCTVYCLPYVLVFAASMYKPIDADLGWHLKYGEYFFQHHRILRDNIFSTQMPDYHWVNSSWLTDLITYAVFHRFSFFGLTLLGAATITVTFFFFAKAAKLSLWAQALLFPSLLYLEIPFFAISFRGQLISLLFLGLLLFILQRFADGKRRWLLVLPPLFTLWVNVHGQFIVGLGLFFLWICFYLATRLYFFMRKRKKTEQRAIIKEAINLSIILAVCTLATLVNPFGIGAYYEVFRHFGNPWQKYIVEWMPFERFSVLWFSHLLMGVVIVLGTVFLFFDKKLKQYMPYIGLSIILYILSLWMRRYSWPMYLIALFVMKPIADYFQPKSVKKSMAFATVIVLVTLVIIVKSKSPFSQYSQASWREYCEHWQCSTTAVEFMIQNGLTNNAMTLYHWGGWLIWNYPALKPSIDGRMHLWRDEKGYSAFAQYYPIEQNLQDVDASPYNIVFMSWDKPVANRLLALAEQGKWQLVYDDDNAGVFVRSPSHASQKEQ